MNAIQKIIDEGRPVEPYCFDIDNEETWYKIGVHDGYDHAIKVKRKQMVDKACKLLCDICYFGKSAYAKGYCEVCKAEGGDYWRFTKLAEE